jgi:hypothetical protein
MEFFQLGARQCLVLAARLLAALHGQAYQVMESALGRRAMHASGDHPNPRGAIKRAGAGGERELRSEALAFPPCTPKTQVAQLAPTKALRVGCRHGLLLQP